MVNVLFWALGGLIILFIAIIIYYYNRFSVLSNRIDNSLSQIDVQLKRRADLIPNLLETVKGYVKHEKELIQEVTNARKALLSAGTLEKRIKADNQLEGALKSIFALAENYPNLKANENFLELQRELATTEDKIAYSRQFYNDSILTYNTLCTTIPGKIFASIFNRKEKEYIKIAPSEREVVKVKF